MEWKSRNTTLVRFSFRKDSSSNIRPADSYKTGCQFKRLISAKLMNCKTTIHATTGTSILFIYDHMFFKDNDICLHTSSTLLGGTYIFQLPFFSTRIKPQLLGESGLFAKCILQNVKVVKIKFVCLFWKDLWFFTASNEK